MTHRYLRPAALAVVSMLLVAACGGGDDDSSAASTTSDPFTGGVSAETTPEVTDPPATDPSPTDPPATEPSVTEPAPAPTTAAPTTAAPEPDTGECLVGAWAVTEDQMNAFYTGLMSTMDAPLNIVATGVANLTFRADGTYQWAPAFDLLVEVAGTSGTGVTTGTIDGNWSAADGVVTTASDVNALDVSITVGGTTINGSDMANGMLNSSPVNGVTYTCAGSTPVLDFQTSDPAVTIPITLTPA